MAIPTTASKQRVKEVLYEYVYFIINLRLRQINSTDIMTPVLQISSRFELFKTYETALFLRVAKQFYMHVVCQLRAQVESVFT